jgi:hypothetical protein
LLITMAVTGDAGFRQDRQRDHKFSARYPSFEKEGAVFQAGNIRPVLPGANCDLDKFDPVARDWDKESRPRAP